MTFQKPFSKIQNIKRKARQILTVGDRGLYFSELPPPCERGEGMIWGDKKKEKLDTKRHFFTFFLRYFTKHFIDFIIFNVWGKKIFTIRGSKNFFFEKNNS